MLGSPCSPCCGDRAIVVITYSLSLSSPIYMPHWDPYGIGQPNGSFFLQSANRRIATSRVIPSRAPGVGVSSGVPESFTLNGPGGTTAAPSWVPGNGYWIELQRPFFPPAITQKLAVSVSSAPGCDSGRAVSLQRVDVIVAADISGSSDVVRPNSLDFPDATFVPLSSRCAYWAAGWSNAAAKSYDGGIDVVALSTAMQSNRLDSQCELSETFWTGQPSDNPSYSRPFAAQWQRPSQSTYTIDTTMMGAVLELSYGEAASVCVATTLAEFDHTWNYDIVYYDTSVSQPTRARVANALSVRVRGFPVSIP